MALATFGSNAQTTLSALLWKSSSPIADIASICNGIKNDLNTPDGCKGAFANNGILYVPNRGVLKLRPGDWVALTSTGFPILLSAAAVAADFTHNP
jgi:hypothetical protein